MYTQHEINQHLRAMELDKLFNGHIPEHAYDFLFSVFRDLQGRYSIGVGFSLSNTSAKALSVDLGSYDNPNPNFPLSFAQWQAVMMLAVEDPS